ncbi:MAG: HAMP domain-containing protein [Clostridia bacterium]|nr:HAMP domain-containing protein [Clostridia bacterium]
MVFVLVLTLANVSFLVNFFVLKEKNSLKEQLLVVSELDFSNSQQVINTITEINEKYNFDVEIYNSFGIIEYTTHGGQMLDFFQQNNNHFSMSHENMAVIESETLSDGIVFEKALRGFDKNEFLVCRKQLNNELFAETRIQKKLISNSAAIANEFITIISIVCFIISIFWVFIFARKFSKPIANMNEITKDMAELNFERRLDTQSNDEIGQLAVSINNLSSSLSSALSDLRTTNAKLKDEIELERQLDAMRRGFVANVSHELKTPISIISGYAEGLKLDINPKSRESYCDIIIEESQRMNKLVLSILELSRYESGQIPLNKQSFDIALLSSDMLTRILKNKNISSENKIPENTLCFADEVQIEQVLKSLLENAVAHTNEGGNIRIESAQKDKKLRISVFHTGENIPDELMPQIWQSFFRGDTSHKRDSSRFGLGLSIVAAVMKLHNTNCGVYNTENGVCFWFEVEKRD